MSDDVLTISLLGVYDNSSEPLPLFAHVAAARAAIVVSTVLSAAAVLFRLYTRLVIVKKSGWDDVLLGVYLVLGAVLSVLVFELTKLGWGMHILKLKVITTIQFRHIFYFAYGLYTVATAIIKLSLLFQYLRIPSQGRVCHWLIITAITGVSIWGIIFSILAWYPCTKVSLFWDADDIGFFSSPHCWFFASPYVREVRTAYLSHGVTNMILDMVVLLLAAPLFWRKDKSARTNRGLLALVTMGAFVTGLAIWRVRSIIKNQTGTWPTLDPFFYTPTTIVLSYLEISCASVVASVPVFWPVLLRQISRIIVVEVTKEQQLDGHRGWSNNSEGGQSVASHDIYMASITNPLMAPVPPGRSPRGFGPHKPSSFSSSSSLRPPPPMREAGTLSRSHSSDSLGRQQQQRQYMYAPLGQQDIGGSPPSFGPPPPGPGSVRSTSLLSVEDPKQSLRRKTSRHMAFEMQLGR
ncbi:hypothetical protein MAPG_05102 [Magnaporthiopsis poae ATCC 64411]|uniref:Rhodopsin domain-containing protein n=1 Tax=Magnaporthiopsis poae (strain ATCC 64411 / 73-15) TaxID=644358 RepID=A0A0C4DYI0_MAGP6|nr:hypothetical protein MAPG_05102 [Magnaporthiopsis poae ATCC 64411]